MAAAKTSAMKKVVIDPKSSRPEKRKRSFDDSDLDLDLSSEMKGIITALQQIKEKAQKDGLKKSEETIGSVASEVKVMLDDANAKIEKDRQNFMRATLKSAKEFESLLRSEQGKLQAAYEKFCKDKTAHMQAFKDIFSKFEEEKEKMLTRYEQQRKKEKAMILDIEKSCANKINAAEEALKKKKQDDKSFSILKKSLGSFFDDASDDDFGSEE